MHEIIDDFHETQLALQIRSMDSPRLTAESARLGITTSHNLSMRFTLPFAREHHSSAALDEFRCVALKEQLNANGENPKVIQELLRHANLKVTMDT